MPVGRAAFAGKMAEGARHSPGFSCVPSEGFTAEGAEGRRDAMPAGAGKMAEGARHSPGLSALRDAIAENALCNRTPRVSAPSAVRKITGDDGPPIAPASVRGRWRYPGYRSRAGPLRKKRSLERSGHLRAFCCDYATYFYGDCTRTVARAAAPEASRTVRR
jgi:hypothetical protein